MTKLFRTKALFIISITLLLLFILKVSFKKEKEPYISSYRQDTLLNILNSYATDSIDICAMVGDTFLIPSTPSLLIRKGVFVVELINAREPLRQTLEAMEKPLLDSTQNYFAVIDIKQKKLIGIYGFREGAEYSLIDYYKDTLYLTGALDISKINFINTKTRQYGNVIVDPCSNDPAGSMVRTGNNLFITAKPYSASVINWNTKYCTEAQEKNSTSGSACRFLGPIQEDINLIIHSQLMDDNGVKRIQAYDKYNHKLWSYNCNPNNSYFIPYKKYFIGVEDGYIIAFRKESGKIEKKFFVGNDYQLFDIYKNTIRVNRGDMLHNYDEYELKSFDFDSEKELWTKKIYGILVHEVNNHYVSAYHDSTTNSETRYVYDKNDLSEIQRLVYKATPLYEEVRKFEIDTKGLPDRASDTKYIVSGKMLYW